MIVRTGEPDDIPALQAIEKKARTVYAALAGFEFVAASPPIAADRIISGTTLRRRGIGVACGLCSYSADGWFRR